MGHPCPGEAVRLLLLEDGRLVPPAVHAGLHGVAELMGQHHAHGLLAQLRHQCGQQLLVVVGHEVAEDAVERVHLDVGVLGGGAVGTATGDGFLPAGVGGEHATGERLERLPAHHLREGAGPERLDVAEHGREEAVVVPCLLRGTEVHHVGDDLVRALHRGGGRVRAGGDGLVGEQSTTTTTTTAAATGTAVGATGDHARVGTTAGRHQDCGDKNEGHHSSAHVAQHRRLTRARMARMAPVLSTPVLHARLERARAVMAETGVDLLLLSVGSDLPYLTGYEAMPLERLTMLVVP
ncbi:MAG: aminopeptidase P family N-terminal domain-containing protein, partial [Ilumatobacter sp.]|nr:aminopeptidase P family N-terminal domain-containing protein [Ilumatobacter sp.]